MGSKQRERHCTRIFRYLYFIAYLTSASLTAAQPSTPPTAADTSPTAAEAPADELRQRARDLLAEGNRALDKGLYLEALRRFEEAYGWVPSPKLHFNIAQTLYELGRPLEALQHYEKFASAVNDPDMQLQQNIATKRIFELQGKVSGLVVQVNVPGATVTLDGQQIGLTPLPAALRLLPGSHVLIVDKPAFERRVLDLSLRAGASHTERVELITETQALAQRAEFRRAQAERLAAEQRLSAERSEAQRKNSQRRARLRRGATVALLAGGASAAVALAASGLYWHEDRQLQAASPGDSWAEELSPHYDRALRWRSVAIIAGATAAISLGTGSGLWWYSRKPDVPERQRTLAFTPLANGAALSFSQRF